MQEKKRTGKKLYIKSVRTETKFDIGWFVVADGTRRPSVSRVVSN